jgi:four helix bundle protein
VKDYRFRFQDLQIWQKAADLGVAIDELSEILDDRRKYRFAEQLRAAALSISNNIAEGSGSNSTADFRKFLYIARKSAFESASMLLLLNRRQYFNEKQVEPHIAELDSLCRMIVSFAEKLD